MMTAKILPFIRPKSPGSSKAPFSNAGNEHTDPVQKPTEWPDYNGPEGQQRIAEGNQWLETQEGQDALDELINDALGG